MKKYLFFLVLFSFLINTFVFAAILPPTSFNPSEFEKTQLDEIKKFSSISFVEYEKILGHKASRVEKYAYMRINMKAAKMFDREGNLLPKYQKRFLKAEGKAEGSFWGGFALGLLFGFVGLLVALFTNRDRDKKKRVRGAIWGFIIWNLIGLAILIMFLASIRVE
jgi:uncharacterized membrane protein YhaH (DUF805 family)